MYEINWNRFAIKNADAQTAFEAMCRILFLRKYNIGGYGFSSNFNQAGLEIEPILCEEKHHGFQCKYSTSGNSTAFYQELFDSLKKAADIYLDLDTVIVYTNLDVKPIPNPEECAKSYKKKPYRIKIAELAKEKEINLIWVSKTNFESLLNEITNLDLYKLYFSPQDELGFISASITVQERTFLNSNQFVDLPVNNSKFSQIQDEILESTFSMITGAAGTGKSEMLKKIFLKCENDFLSALTGTPQVDNAPTPIFIRLRDCINGNLEDLLRNRLRDYEIAIDGNSSSFIYFFDGIDEVNSIDFSGISACLVRLNKKPNTKSIVLSSRTNTANLTMVYREFSVKIFEIAPITVTDIESYFYNCYDKERTGQLYKIQNEQQDLIADITDIFSVMLLWENIAQVSNTTTKIDLILLSVKSLIERSRKYAILDLPEPKTESIETILCNISEEMQRTKSINISRIALQKIVNKCFSNTSYREIDTIIDYICEMFFERSPSFAHQQTHAYRHKRYFELYLYRSVKRIFYKEPLVLRELHLLSNKDFMLNIFLPQELKDNIENKDLHKVLVLRFLEAYLGEDYIGDKMSPWFVQKSNFAGGSESYLESSQLRDYLCLKEFDDLHTFLKNDSLSISSFLKPDNYWSFIRHYYEVKQKDIRPLLDKVFKIDDSWKEKAISKDPCSYWYCKCVIDNVLIEDIYRIVSELDYKNIESDLDHISIYSHNNASIAANFFEIAIAFSPEWMVTIIETISIEQLEIVCYTVLRTRATRHLFSQSAQFVRIRNAICNRIASNKETSYKINTIVLYNILTNQDIQREDIEARIRKANISHYGTWEHNLELNCYSAILLKDTFRAAHTNFMLGISIRQILVQNYAENKVLNLNIILQEIKKYNLIYDNWFSFNNSLLIGELLACLSLEVYDIKQFISELRKYPSVISLFTVLYTIMKENIDLFMIIANQRLIAFAYNEASHAISYYDNNSDTGFMYATMMSYFDLTKGDALFENALNNSIFRPIFRKEDIIDYYLPQCLLITYDSDWLIMPELEKAINRVDKMLEISHDTLDSGAYRESFKFLVEKCMPDSPILSKLHDWSAISPYRSMKWTNGAAEIIVEPLTVENLLQYYNCEIEGINYSSMPVWKTLIEFEYQHDSELQILYKALDKNYFPAQNIAKMNHCFHIIIAILISGAETKDRAIEYVMHSGGRLGLVNMINVFSLTGTDSCACQYLESLLGLCEALVYPSKAQLVENREKWEHSAAIVDIVCNSDREQWNIDDENNRMFFKNDSKISIRWDEVDHDELFKEDWATHHCDSKAYKVKYYIYCDQNIVETFYLAYIDGFRALIPMPNYATQCIKRKDYLFGKLLTNSVKNYNEYIAISGLMVE